MPTVVDLGGLEAKPTPLRVLRAQPPELIPARWPESAGTGGRFPPDWVAGLLRIGWPISAGMPTKLSTDTVAAVVSQAAQPPGPDLGPFPSISTATHCERPSVSGVTI